MIALFGLRDSAKEQLFHFSIVYALAKGYFGGQNDFLYP